ncbi:MAG: hypothetical protein ACOX1U_10455, partial [Saccharofermentanales bacterium]
MTQTNLEDYLRANDWPVESVVMMTSPEQGDRSDGDAGTTKTSSNHRLSSPGPRGRTPVYATAGSARLRSLRFGTDHPPTRGDTALSLDLVMALEPGVECSAFGARSGLSLNTTLRIPNAPGTIDSD